MHCEKKVAVLDEIVTNLSESHACFGFYKATNIRGLIENALFVIATAHLTIVSSSQKWSPGRADFSRENLVRSAFIFACLLLTNVPGATVGDLLVYSHWTTPLREKRSDDDTDPKYDENYNGFWS